MRPPVHDEGETSSSVDSAPGRLRWWITLAVVAVTGAVVAVTLLRNGPGVDDALAVVNDEPRFSTSQGGAEAFAEAASILQRAGRQCSESGGVDAARCGALLQASAYAQVAALRLLRCTLPHVYDAREAMAGYLEQLHGTERDAVEPPPLPEC